MNEETTKYQKAKEKVASLRGFYTHLTVYLAVNTLLFIIKINTVENISTMKKSIFKFNELILLFFISSFVTKCNTRYLVK